MAFAERFFIRINIKRMFVVFGFKALVKDNSAALFRQYKWSCYCKKFYGSIPLFSFLAEKIVCTPPMAESITEGVLSAWEKKVGDVVSQDELVANIETDKITLPVAAPESGKILEFFAKEGDTVTVGSHLFKMDTTTESSSASEHTQNFSKEQFNQSHISEKKTPSSSSTNVETPRSTSAQAEKKEKPKHVVDTEKDEGSFRKKDASQSSFAMNSEKLESPPKKVFDERTETRKRLSPMRAKIASHLKASQDVNASLTTFNEIDMSSLIEFRKLHKDYVLKNHDVKFGFMSPFIMAVTRALQEIPMVNSRIEDSDIITPSFVDISVAVATPKGLVTPVLRDCHLMNGLIDVEKRLAELAELARSNNLTPNHLKGGTFTISNGGIFGSLNGTPIINMPQSAILGMHAIKERAVVVGGQVAIRPMMNVALTYDHRIIDGREAVTFLIRLKSLLEDPRLFLL